MTEAPANRIRRPPRLNHKKSRAGCQRCKARRVKVKHQMIANPRQPPFLTCRQCDEAKPSCAGCTRHNVSCVYLVNEPRVSNPSDTSLSPHPRPPIKTQSSSGTSHTATPPKLQDAISPDDLLNLPESRERRLLELRLWHNYVTVVATPFHPAAPVSPVASIWNNRIPYLALQHDNLLNIIYAISATRLLRDTPDDTVLHTAHRTYLSLALRQHREAVAQPIQHAYECDAVCFASVIMTMDAFGVLEERNRHPYKPPTDMLRLGMGTCAVYEEALKSARDLPESKIIFFLESQPFHHEIGTMFDEKHRLPFLSVLGPKNDQGIYEDSELWDPQVMEAYESTLSYIGTMFAAVQKEEPLQSICTRIIAFTLYVPKRFVDMLEELRPRALVILAHFFALATKASAHWWVGQTPMREVQGLRRIVPPEWQRHLRWPLVMSGLEPV